MKKIVLGAAVLMALALAGCQQAEQRDPKKVALFVPGVVQGSPIYETLVKGATEAVEATPGATLKVVEGGYDQSKWEEQLTSIAAGPYGLVVTSNSVMPELCAKAAAKAPGSRFLVLDGKLEGNEAIYTVQYDQREQAYMAGYMAGLWTKSKEKGMNAALKVGLIAGQEYPIMNDVLKAGILEGARAAAPGCELDFRVVGGWNDSVRAGELASAMIEGGVDVIVPIAGGGGMGVLTVAKEKGAKVVWFDSDGYAIERGVVVGSAVVEQAKTARDKLFLYFAGVMPFGKSDTLGVKDGAVNFVEDDPIYADVVPEAIRKAQAAMIASIRDGSLSLPQ